VSADWVLARASGLGAFALLTLAVALGLALGLRLASPAWPRFLTNELHRFVTVLALWMTALHLVTLLVDSQSGISLTAVLVPFAADRDAVATGLGVLALDLVIAVWLSTLVRARIGYRTWRRLHRLALVAWGIALAHGLLSGTDTGRAWTTVVYLTSAALVGSLLVAWLGRLFEDRRGRARRDPEPRTPAAPPAPDPAPSGLPPLPPLGAHPAPAGGLPPLALRPEATGLPPLRGTGIPHGASPIRQT
jgi:methionine sulfoxide reductase heme-binding subunit